MSMPLKSSDGPSPVLLSVRKWRQFGRVDVQLHPQLTVLVGPNGTGKSTLLSLLSLLLERPDSGTDTPTAEPTTDSRQIGAIELANEQSLKVYDREGAQEQVLAGNSVSLDGSFHHATKLLFGRANTRGISALIPVGGSSGNRAYVVAKHIVTFASSTEVRPSILRRLITQWDNWAMFSEHSSSMIRQPPDQLAERVRRLKGSPEQVFRRFADLFVRIAGEACGIQAIAIQGERLVANTRSGSFSLDGLSHGLALVAMLLWDCVLLDAIAGKGLMLIDEPENHLHPGLQRSLMASLVAEFPRIQFVVATHSPFFVGAARESVVCLLAYDDGGRVTSRMLRDQELDRGGTANDILREALGTTTSRPIWLEDELRSRVAKYASRTPDRHVVATLHSELKEQGQGDLLPDAVRVLKKMQEERSS